MTQQPLQESERVFRCVECGQEHDDYDRECSLECNGELVEVVAAPDCPHVTPGPLLGGSMTGVAGEFRVCGFCGAKLYD